MAAGENRPVCGLTGCPQKELRLKLENNVEVSEKSVYNEDVCKRGLKV